jgi:hypothetical protein
MRTSISATVALMLALAYSLHAQDNYEIQVYGSDTVEKGKTIVELHSNFTIKGRKNVEDGLAPTHHAWHETLEVTTGITKNFELGFYLFTSLRNGDGWDIVGTHIRPRVKAPDEWKLPVGLSLSAEFGYQRRKFSEDTWTLELRPIIDKEIGKWYMSFNPTVEKSFKGVNKHNGFEFSPNVKVSYNVTKKVGAGIEYYGGLGPIGNFDSRKEQEHQFFPVIDLYTSPKWEFNMGVGIGVTPSTEHLIAKFLVGRRFEFGKH